MFKILYPILFLLLCSCQTPTPIDIKGDWVPIFVADKTTSVPLPYPKTFMTFSFEDSICSYGMPYWEFPKYQLKKDTLLIWEKKIPIRSGMIGGSKVFKFLVRKPSDSTLYLIPLSEETKKILQIETDYDIDTIRLLKIRPKNNIKIDRIGFYSDMCYGKCPMMQLEIDRLGNFFFWGQNHTDVKGAHSGQIPENDWAVIQQKIRQLNLDSLELDYISEIADGQTCGIVVQSDDKTYIRSASGFAGPIELDLLFHKLMEVYKRVELVPDSNAIKQFRLQDFRYRPLPPPSPPPTN